GIAIEVPQDETQATYFGRRGPEDGRIIWTQTSRQIFNLIRAVTDPFPGAFSEVGVARLMVWWAETDSLAVREVLARTIGEERRNQDGRTSNISLASVGRRPG